MQADKHRFGKTRIALLFFVCLIFTGNAAASEAPAGVKAEPVITKVTPLTHKTVPAIVEYKLPNDYSHPFGLAIDAANRIWMTEALGNRLAVFDPAAQTLKEYVIPSTASLPKSSWKYGTAEKSAPEDAYTISDIGHPGNIIVDSRGIIWFVMQIGNSVVRFDPAQEIFWEIMIPHSQAQPYDLAEGKDNIIWVVEKNSGSISYIDFESRKSGEIHVSDNAQLMGIAAGPDGMIWVSNVAGNYIGRYDPKTKLFHEFTINVPQSQPGMIRLDKNGYVWFCALHAQQLGILMPDPGIFSVADLPGYNGVPQALAIAANDRVWVLDSMQNKVGYFDTAKVVWNMFDIPINNSQPSALAIDSSGDIWFTLGDRHANSFAKVVASTVPDPGLKTGPEKGDKQTGQSAGPENERPMGMASLIAAGVLGLLVSLFILFRKKKTGGG